MQGHMLKERNAGQDCEWVNVPCRLLRTSTLNATRTRADREVFEHYPRQARVCRAAPFIPSRGPVMQSSIDPTRADCANYYASSCGVYPARFRVETAALIKNDILVLEIALGEQMFPIWRDQEERVTALAPVCR